VTAFVSPAAGEAFWCVSNGVSKPFFEALLRLSAEEAAAGRDRIVVLALGNAGWHSPAGLEVPEGVRLVFQPAYTPEVQPAETLWTLVDEPIVNQHVADLDALDQIISKRCAALADEPQTIRRRAGFHGWPKIANPRRSAGNGVIVRLSACALSGRPTPTIFASAPGISATLVERRSLDASPRANQ